MAARAWRAFLDAGNGTPDERDSQIAAKAWLSASEQAGDHAGQAVALGFLAKLQFWDGQAAAAEEVWKRGVEQAALAGDTREEAESLVWLLIAGMFGPTPVDAALERCEALANRAGASRKVRVVASIERGVLEAMQGQIERGRERVARGRPQLDELGLALLATVAAQEAAIVEQMAGDAPAAETLLRAGFDRLEEMGEAGFQMTVSGMLARALYAQGKLAEAKRFAELLSTRGLRRRLHGHRKWCQSTGRGPRGRRSNGRPTRGRGRDACLSERLPLESRRPARRAGRGPRTRRAGGDALAALARADALYERKGCSAALKWTAARRAALPDD